MESRSPSFETTTGAVPAISGDESYLGSSLFHAFHIRPTTTAGCCRRRPVGYSLSTAAADRRPPHSPVGHGDLWPPPLQTPRHYLGQPPLHLLALDRTSAAALASRACADAGRLPFLCTLPPATSQCPLSVFLAPPRHRRPLASRASADAGRLL